MSESAQPTVYRSANSGSAPKDTVSLGVGLLLALVAIFLILPGSMGAQESPWQHVGEGLFVGEFDPPVKSKIGKSKITILKIDPSYYSFRLLSESELGEKMTAREWARKYGLISAMNAGMFQADSIRNVGYMKNFNHINNPRLNSDNAVLAFNPVDSTVPEIQIIDRKCQDFESIRTKYETLIQSIRMISCHQKNVWSQQDRIWSMVVLGVDKNGNVLFIFTRSPYSVHDFINILLSLPISIYNAMYLEGGPEATLYFSVDGVEFEKVGSYETGYNENDGNQVAWPIPNVIGIVKKTK